MKNKNKNLVRNEGSLTGVLKLIVWGGIALSLLVPLIVNTRMMFPFNAPKVFFFMGVVQLMFFAWFILMYHNEKYRPNKNLIFGAVSVFFVSMILSSVFGADPTHSFWSNYERMSGLLFNLHVFAYFLVLFSFVKTEASWKKVFGGVSVVAVIVAVTNLAHQLGIITLADHFKNGSTLGNTSFMGSYLLVAVFICLYLILKSQKLTRIFYSANFLLISSALLFNPGGRAMKGAFIIGLGLLFVLWLSFNCRFKIVRGFSKAMLVLGFVSAVFVGFSAFNQGSVVNEKIMSLHGMNPRFVVWEKAWDGFKERPILGWGPENFDIVFQNKFDPRMPLTEYGGEIWFDRAHNIVFDVLVEQGILGFLAFFAMFAVAVFVLWRNYLMEKKIDFWAPAIFTSFFVAHFIQNLTVFDMVSSYVLLFMVLAFAASITDDNERAGGERKTSYPVIIVSLIGFVLVFFFLTSVPNGENKDALRAYATPVNNESIVLRYQNANRTPMARSAVIVSFSERLINYSMKEQLEKAEQEGGEEAKIKEQETILKSIDYLAGELEKVFERNSLIFKEPWMIGKLYNEKFDYYHLDKMVSAYMMNQGDDAEKERVREEAEELVLKAKSFFFRAMENGPRNQQGYWDLAQAEINHGKIYFIMGDKEKADEYFQEAYRLVEKAVELEPRYLASHAKLLMTIKGVLVDAELAREKALEAIEINPEWQDALRNYL